MTPLPRSTVCVTGGGAGPNDVCGGSGRISSRVAFIVVLPVIGLPSLSVVLKKLMTSSSTYSGLCIVTVVIGGIDRDGVIVGTTTW